MQTVLKKIDLILARLSTPPTEEEARNGWTRESKAGMHTLFHKMREDALQEKELSSVPEYVGLARGMDHWGISGGSLFDAASDIGALCSGTLARTRR